MVSSDTSLGSVDLKVLFSRYNVLSGPLNMQKWKVLEDQYLLALLKNDKH